VLKIEGITLHSYRYAFAQRCKAFGISERHAQGALGHSSPAVHRAYSKAGKTVCPSLEDYERNIVRLQAPRKDTPKTSADLNIQVDSQERTSFSRKRTLRRTC
jgi:hypothetical protein